jgi:large subunit ribosomal protein L19e
MGLKTVRRLAAAILKAGKSRVKFLDSSKAKEALTRDDVRSLISQGAITVEQKKGVGRAKASFKHSRLHAGRRRGTGSRKGAKFATVDRKSRWIAKVRGQRKLLKTLKGSGALKEGSYRKIYLMVKGDFFRNKKHLISHLRDKKLLEK